MKKLLLFLTLFSALSSFGQSGLRKSPHDTVRSTLATVTYGRPYKNNRDIFGDLEKFSKVWRLGADEATTISFANDVKVAGQTVKAGTYTMFALLNEKEWTIILNTQLGQWGAFSYVKHMDKDILKVNIPVNKLDTVVEQLTIRFGADQAMIIEWDKTQVIVPLSAE